MKRMIITLLTVCIFTSTLFASDKESKREIKKEFSVGANPTLQIENKYGHIRVVEGTESKIIFEIEIIGKGSSADLALKLAESVSIDFSQNGDKVSAKTVFESINCNNCGRTIHYTVVAPKSVTMDLVNKYGNIYLQNAIRPLRVDLKYGNLEANSLADVNIDIKYGNVTLETCADYKMDSGYGKFRIGKANRMNVSSKYDDFQIGTVADFNLDTKYTKVKIDQLNNSFVCNDFKYGSLAINDISTQFSRIKVSAGYSSIKLALDKRHSFKANLSTRYGKINAGNLTFNNVSLGNKERNSDSISGTVGSNANPSATVDISASYGDITLN